MPAAMPTAAPFASLVSLSVTSALASSISSRTRSWALSETSLMAATMLACELSVVAAKTLEDQGGDESAGERCADDDLGPLGGRSRRLGTAEHGAAGRRRVRCGLGARRGWRVRVRAHSGGSSPKARRQIIAAAFVVATEASAPSPARSPDHMSRLTI